MDILGTGGHGRSLVQHLDHRFFVAAAAGRCRSPVSATARCRQVGRGRRASKRWARRSTCPQEQNERVLTETGICFLFAQGYHKSMKNVAPVRKGMRERTLFNVLGPLSNPARATMQCSACTTSWCCRWRRYSQPRRDARHGGLRRGGMDEAGCSGGEQRCARSASAAGAPYAFTPADLCLPTCTVAVYLRGGSPQEYRADHARRTSGKRARRQSAPILLNAGIALYLRHRRHPACRWRQKAAELIGSGAAYAGTIYPDD